MKLITFLILIISLGFVTNSNAQFDYEIDPEESKITFTSYKADGFFGKVYGTIEFSANDLEGSKFEAYTPVESIDLGNFIQTGHAKNDSWLNADKYPRITFVSDTIYEKKKKYVTEGTLDLHGVEKRVSIIFDVEYEGNKAHFTGELTVKKDNYNINDPDTKPASVIDITIDVWATETE